MTGRNQNFQLQHFFYCNSLLTVIIKEILHHLKQLLITTGEKNRNISFD